MKAIILGNYMLIKNQTAKREDLVSRTKNGILPKIRNKVLTSLSVMNPDRNEVSRAISDVLVVHLGLFVFDRRHDAL